jgi:hypothetical protein
VGPDDSDPVLRSGTKRQSRSPKFGRRRRQSEIVVRRRVSRRLVYSSDDEKEENGSIPDAIDSAVTSVAYPEAPM